MVINIDFYLNKFIICARQHEPVGEKMLFRTLATLLSGIITITIAFEMYFFRSQGITSFALALISYISLMGLWHWEALKWKGIVLWSSVCIIGLLAAVFIGPIVDIMCVVYWLMWVVQQAKNRGTQSPW